MENKTTLYIVVALVLAYVLFLRKPGKAVAPTSVIAKPAPAPKPAVQPTTGQVVAAAAISAAPQAIRALGSFFNSGDNSSSDDFDSAAFSDDSFADDL